MSALKKYAKHFIKLKAQEKIVADLKSDALRELGRQPDGKAIVGGVEFHRTVKRKAKYPSDVQVILDSLKVQIDEQKKRAEDAGTVKYSSTPGFDAAIPPSVADAVLRTDPDYKRHFGAI